MKTGRGPLCIAAAFALAGVLPAWGQQDYFGLLKAPHTGLEVRSGFFASSFGEPVYAGLLTGARDTSRQLKLGYQYSRYFSMQGELLDFGRLPGTSFSMAEADSGARRTAFGIDAVGMLPLSSRASFYGRFGTYRGDSRPAFASLLPTLIGDSGRNGMRLRYGLGLRYDFSKAFGVRAEFERYSTAGGNMLTDADSEMVSVGLMWRF
jgi:OmpA-OmpF porin, OOP family